ncbi:MAG: tetratricopeptide repeat protein [Gammaproteobacteria bacterium]|nr:tetratricopeptide repeat protein [Gammaproteobacteria bacterium]
MRKVFPSGALAGLLLLAACATPVERAEKLAAQDEWMKAVLEYRKAYGKTPENIEYKSRLKQTELKAADYYYQRGLKLIEQGNVDAAIEQFQQGLAAMPEHSKLQQAMNDALSRKEAATLYQEGVTYQEAGKLEDARNQYQKALRIYPDYKDASRALAELQKEEAEKTAGKFVLSSKAPITLNFRQTDMRTAFEFIAKSFGVNVIFDEGIKSQPVTLFAKDVTFEQALNLMLTTTKTFYKKIGPNSVLVAPDTKEKRGQYEDYVVRTFSLNTVKAKEMAEILKGMLVIKKIVVNEQLNTILVRDTEDVIRLAERLIENNDRRPAEILLEVEILEVNRTKAERLGLDFGTYQIGAAVPSTATITATSSVAKAFTGNATLTLPSVTFRFFKQDVDAKTLANPKVRVINGKSAKIHIGDRVPLRAATIQDATGQVRTTFDYREIGIRLNVEPNIHLDNSATVKLGLEVSTLGENLGTATEPAYRIGTRNAETFMSLRDGETAILGGLIRDEERNTRVKIPGLGDIPLIGAVFTSYDDSLGRTDVLLTITPRVVRGWELPNKSAREFYSGTENVYSERPVFAYLDKVATVDMNTGAAPAAAPAPVVPSPGPAPVPPAVTTPPPGATPPVAAATAPPPAAVPAVPPTLTFSEPAYETSAGQELQIGLVGENLFGATTIPIELLYNPQLLGFVRGEQGTPAPQSFNVEADETRGVLRVALAYDPTSAPSGNAALARIVLRGNKPGVSYLVYRSLSLRNQAGETVNAQVRASRIVVK